MKIGVNTQSTDHASNLFTRHPLVTYFVLACSISWLIEIPLAASAQGLIAVRLPFALHYLSAYGPALAAIGVIGLTQGTLGLRELRHHLSYRNVRPWWLILCLMSPLVLLGCAALIVYAVHGAWLDFTALGQVNFLPDIGVGAWLLWIGTSGFGEEIGWRGFALPRLQTHYTALPATLILCAVWALWHVPSFFYLPSYLSIGLAGFPGFAFSLLAGAILFTCLYNSSHGSILAVALFHGGFNFVTASKASTGDVAMIIGIIVTCIALLIVIVYHPTNLAGIPRQRSETVSLGSASAAHQSLMIGRNNAKKSMFG